MNDLVLWNKIWSQVWWPIYKALYLYFYLKNTTDSLFSIQLIVRYIELPIKKIRVELELYKQNDGTY